jgi:hypothetical protein
MRAPSQPSKAHPTPIQTAIAAAGDWPRHRDRAFAKNRLWSGIALLDPKCSHQ